MPSLIDSPSVLSCGRVIAALLSDQLLFVVVTKDRKWRETTLVRRGTERDVGAGETARLVSWTGRYDRTMRSGGFDRTDPFSRLKAFRFS